MPSHPDFSKGRHSGGLIVFGLTLVRYSVTLFVMNQSPASRIIGIIVFAVMFFVGIHLRP
jgi:hypothetical protein